MVELKLNHHWGLTPETPPPRGSVARPPPPPAPRQIRRPPPMTATSHPRTAD